MKETGEIVEIYEVKFNESSRNLHIKKPRIRRLEKVWQKNTKPKPKKIG